MKLFFSFFKKESPCLYGISMQSLCIDIHDRGDLMRGVLILEDNTVFKGEFFGSPGTSAGEVVFTTGMVGYQEVLTDPSFQGQIITMTFPLIGNYGINDQDAESETPKVSGLIMREGCSLQQHWRASQTLGQYLEAHNIVALQGVDTRALTRHLRSHGTMAGMICSKPEGFTLNPPSVKPVAQVATTKPYRIPGRGQRVVVLDLGVKRGILRYLSSLDCDIIITPYWDVPQNILKYRPDGVLLSNGPGDPKEVPEAVHTASHLLGVVAMMGICLGHQILALACGGDTYKMKFGHRGQNHPVKNLLTGGITITSQNHGYAVSDESLTGLPLEVTHRNQNDGTIEGIRHKRLPVFSVQYHPEGSPGPEDSVSLFHEFIDLMQP